eukprot:GHVO01016379.1.p1 GENE.GHVO01016379.1~~GHVO01016379.1.p1  ORF type:complete len:213 (+),score=31.12 GHVO01016379.1:508-1146(+)
MLLSVMSDQTMDTRSNLTLHGSPTHVSDSDNNGGRSANTTPFIGTGRVDSDDDSDSDSGDGTYSHADGTYSYADIEKKRQEQEVLVKIQLTQKFANEMPVMQQALREMLPEVEEAAAEANKNLKAGTKRYEETRAQLEEMREIIGCFQATGVSKKMTTGKGEQPAMESWCDNKISQLRKQVADIRVLYEERKKAQTNLHSCKALPNWKCAET